MTRGGGCKGCVMAIACMCLMFSPALEPPFFFSVFYDSAMGEGAHEFVVAFAFMHLLLDFFRFFFPFSKKTGDW